jgi:hypothetical protein
MAESAVAEPICTNSQKENAFQNEAAKSGLINRCWKSTHHHLPPRLAFFAGSEDRLDFSLSKVAGID